MFDGEICKYLNIKNIGKSDLNNLTTKFAVLDSAKNLTFFEWIFSPMIHQLTVAKCAFQFEIAFVESPQNQKSIDLQKEAGIWSPIWPYILLPGIFTCVSVLFNFSLILVTFTKIKDHKVCNWLLAFDSLCQLFFVCPFIVNLLALILQYTSVDYRICVGTLTVSTVASYASFLAIYLVSVERLLIVLFPIRMNWVKETTIRRLSVFSSVFCILFGIFMVFNLFGVFVQFNLTYESLLYCNSVFYSDTMYTPISQIVLSLCVLNYVAIAGKILWRHFKLRMKGPNQLASIPPSDHSMRKMLRSVFVLSLVILIGWLISTVLRNRITSLLLKAFNTILNLFVNNAKKDATFMNNLSIACFAFFACLPILTSASGAPILLFSENYRDAYKKLFKRSNSPSVGPLFAN